MKKLLLFFSILFLTGVAFPQSRKELKLEIENYKKALTTEQQKCAELKRENDRLYLRLENIRSFILQETERRQDDSLTTSRRSAQTSESSDITGSTQQDRSNQCAAITKQGTRCSRSVHSGSKFCWQHQNYESGSAASSGYSGGHTWHTGPRGGQYYINSKGNKVYKKKR